MQVGRASTTRRGAIAGRMAWPAVAALALMLGGCLSTVVADRKVTLPEPPKDSAQPAPALREHQRILGAYNGAYEDPRLEGLIKLTVDKLVAASERPDQRYKIPILNSPAINAFA